MSTRTPCTPIYVCLNVRSQEFFLALFLLLLLILLFQGSSPSPPSLSPPEKALVILLRVPVLDISNRKILGTSWMAIREKNFKYLDAQQVGQQISIIFKSEFHNEGGDWEKKLRWNMYFSGNDLICCPRKFQPSQTPLHVFLPISPRYLTDANIFHWIFG